MSEWRETFRGVVLHWECDLNDHLTAREYFSKFDAAAYFLLSEIGVADTALRARGKSTAAVSRDLRYLEELREGALIIIRSAVTGVGRTSVGHSHKMFNGASGRLAAACRGVDVLFDLAERRASTWPDDLRACLDAAVVGMTEEDLRLFGD